MLLAAGLAVVTWPEGAASAAIVAAAIAAALAILTSIMLYRARPTKSPFLAAEATPAMAVAAVTSAPTPAHSSSGGDDSFSLEGTALAPIDRYFPARPRPFLLLSLLVGLGAWAVGYALAPDKARFLASPEWRFMPFYLVAHLVAVRLFVTAFTRNFRAGIRHIDVKPAAVVRGVRLILGPVGVLLAALIALPFCYLDFLYLTGAESRYERLGLNNTVAAVDLWMWLSWCIEWLLNALIWLMLVVFMIKNCSIISRYAFRSPIEVVVHERHYRPFLRMSSQGATIILGFSAVTIFYLWYTGGEVTDYAGLAITTSLLVIGFVPSWILLRRKVRRAVESETQALRHALAGSLWRDAEAKKGGAAASPPPTLEQRLEEALAIFRVSYLEQLQLNLGRHEARAILLRLLAPAIGALWQLRSSLDSWQGHLDGAWRQLRMVLIRLLG
ncbi:MAG: hypothetical protein ACKVP7_15680 [Hyphomicrobiaceae bacterium]